MTMTPTDPPKSPPEQRNRGRGRPKGSLNQSKILTHQVSYKPSPKQMEFHRLADEFRVVALFGGIRGGKSMAGAYQDLRNMYVHRLRPARGAIVVPTYNEGKGVVERFREAAGPLIKQELVREHSFLMYPPRGFDEPYLVEIRSADDPNSIRGRDYAWLHLDEARDMSEAMFQVSLGRVLDTGGKIIITTTPAGKSHWLYRKFMGPEKNPDWKVVNLQTYDNPYLDQTLISELEKEYGEELARQELRGEFIDLKGLVYPMFDRDRHVINEIEATRLAFDKDLENGEPAYKPKVYCGIDFGYGHHFVCLWIVAVRDRFIVLDEHAQRYLPTKEHARKILANPLANRVLRYYCDPNALQSRMDLQAAGVPLVPSPKIPGSPEKRGEEMVRIRLVSRLLNESAGDGKPKLLISERCPVLLRQISQQMFDRNGYPQRVNDDAPDALGYALRGIIEYGMKHSPLYSKIYVPGGEEDDEEAWEELAKPARRTYDELYRGVPRWMLNKGEF